MRHQKLFKTLIVLSSLVLLFIGTLGFPMGNIVQAETHTVQSAIDAFGYTSSTTLDTLLSDLGASGHNDYVIAGQSFMVVAGLHGTDTIDFVLSKYGISYSDSIENAALKAGAPQSLVDGVNAYIDSHSTSTTSAGQEGVVLPGDTTVSPTTTCTEDGTGDYCLLAPLPNIEKVTPQTSFGTYLNAIIKFTIGFAGVLAVIMLVLAGIEYMGTDSFTKKGDASDRMTHAIGGLLLALAAFLILNTINPNLVNLHLGIKKQTIEVQEILDSGEIITIVYSSNVGECPTSCTKLKGAGGVDVPYESSGDSVAMGFKPLLQSLTTQMQNTSISWTTTEAWQPSRVHKAHCHQVGTCIDANFRGLSDNSNPPPEKVRDFISAAITTGLCPVYEVKTAAQLQNILDAGISNKNVKNLGTWISAPHFSVYGGSCK